VGILDPLATPRPPKQRIVDLRAGDQVLFQGKWRSIKEIAASSESWVTAEQAQRPRECGYCYKPMNRTAADLPVIWCNDSTTRAAR
jgi:hypothetical protein